MSGDIYDRAILHRASDLILTRALGSIPDWIEASFQVIEKENHQ